MALPRLYHLTLLPVFFVLLLAGLVATDLPAGGKKVGKKVTMTLQCPAADSPPGEKITISTHYVGEDGVSESHSHLELDNGEYLGTAVKQLVRILEKVGEEEAAGSDVIQWMDIIFQLVYGKIKRRILRASIAAKNASSSFARMTNHSMLGALRNLFRM